MISNSRINYSDMSEKEINYLERMLAEIKDGNGALSNELIEELYKNEYTNASKHPIFTSFIKNEILAKLIPSESFYFIESIILGHQKHILNEPILRATNQLSGELYLEGVKKFGYVTNEGTKQMGEDATYLTKIPPPTINRFHQIIFETYKEFDDVNVKKNPEEAACNVIAQKISALQCNLDYKAKKIDINKMDHSTLLKYASDSNTYNSRAGTHLRGGILVEGINSLNITPVSFTDKEEVGEKKKRITSIMNILPKSFLKEMKNITKNAVAFMQLKKNPPSIDVSEKPVFSNSTSPTELIVQLKLYTKEKHMKGITELIEKITAINNDTRFSSDKKYIKAIGIIEDALLKQQDKYNKTLGFLRKDSFIDILKNENAHDFSYPKLLVNILNAAYNNEKKDILLQKKELFGTYYRKMCKDIVKQVIGGEEPSRSEKIHPLK